MELRNWLVPGGAQAVAAALVLALAGTGACQRQAQDASAIPHTPLPKAEARLELAEEAGRIRYDGVVVDEAARGTITQALEAAAPGATGTLAVEPLTQPASWAGAVGPAAAALRGTGCRLQFGGRRIELGGDPSEEQRATLYREIRQLYPGYELTGAFQGADPRHALPDGGDAAGLLAFLNAGEVEFREGTGMLTSASVAGLARAARGLQAAGAATRVEVHVHPEAGGDADEQRAIARQRADAILTQLALRGVAPARLRGVVAEPAAGGQAQPTVEFLPFRPGAAMADETLDEAATEGGAAPEAAAPTDDDSDADAEAGQPDASAAPSEQP